MEEANRCSSILVYDSSLVFSISFWNDINEPVFDGVGLVGLRAEPMLSSWPNLHSRSLSRARNYFPIFFLTGVRCVELGLRINRVNSLSPSLALLTLFNNINNNNDN